MPTVTQMEARARVLADQDQSTFPTSAHYLEFISDGAQELYGRMVAAGLVPARTDTPVTLNGATSYSLGTSVQVVLSVERHEGNERIPLQRAQVEEVPYLRGAAGSGVPTHYDLVGGATAGLSIEFYPLPQTGTITVRFIPVFTRFTAGGDNFYGPPRSDEYIVVYAAIAALGKEGEEAGRLGGKLKAIYDDILQFASWQDAQNPGRIRDVRRNHVRHYPFDDFRVSPEWDW
jgi:hypothetical protein